MTASTSRDTIRQAIDRSLEIAELEATSEPVVRALLRLEFGRRAEAKADDADAAREYLLAHKDDDTLREPLEALVRLLGRRRSTANLAKLLDAVAQGPGDGEERSAALRQRALLELEPSGDRIRARELLEAALELAPGDAHTRLELEALARSSRDDAFLERILTSRIEHAASDDVAAMARLERALVTARRGEPERALDDALEALRDAAPETWNAREAALVVERLARRLGRTDVLAEVLELRCAQPLPVRTGDDEPDLVVQLDGDPGEAATRLASLILALMRKRQGQHPDALDRLARAAEGGLTGSILDDTRLSLLEAQGSVDEAATMARSLLSEDRDLDPSFAAALWLRVAEAAAAAAQTDEALAALDTALEADPSSVLARVVQLELLADGRNPEALARGLEALVEFAGTPAAKSRALQLAALVWAGFGQDATRARRALDAAHRLVPSTDHDSLGDALSAIGGATKPSTASHVGSDPRTIERALIDLRTALLTNDGAGRERALQTLGGRGAPADGVDVPAAGRWLSGVLGSLLPSGGATHSAPPGLPARLGSLEAWAESEDDPSVSRALATLSAGRAARAGLDAREAFTRLHEAVPSDEIVGLALAEQSRGDAACAELLGRLSDFVMDAELAGAMRLESALRRLRAGDPAGATLELQRAVELLPELGPALGAWAPRLSRARTLEDHRARLDGAPTDPSTAVERLGAEIAWASRGSLESASESLRALEFALVETAGLGGFAEPQAADAETVAALARLIWPEAESSASELERALEVLATRGADAARTVGAEKLRIARDLEEDVGQAASLARSLAELGPGLAEALEWVGAAGAAQDRESEIAARRHLAKQLTGADAEAIAASAALLAMLDRALVSFELARLEPVAGGSAAARLANLELAPAGAAAEVRADALLDLGDAMGEDARIEALLLGGFAALASSDFPRAWTAFREVLARHPDDLAAWEGVRSAAVLSGNAREEAIACAKLGTLCLDDARAAAFLERAGLLLLASDDTQAEGEAALEQAFARSPRIGAGFDRLFRMVRSRKDDLRLLALIDRRLEVTTERGEVTKLVWERARASQSRGDADGALASLEQLRRLEPSHVGALALAGTIFIQRGDFERAAEHMALLASNPEAPRQERLVSGVTAADLFDGKLGRAKDAVVVLRGLEQDGIATTPVRERLVRAAARAGDWRTTTSALERLMVEREEPKGRIEAARLCLAIWRDKLREPTGARASVERLLRESPDDPEALGLLLATEFEASFRNGALLAARDRLIDELRRNPVDAARVRLLHRTADVLKDDRLRIAVRGALPVVVAPERPLDAELDAHVASPPNGSVGLEWGRLMPFVDSSFDPSLAGLLPIVDETLSAALGSTLDALDVGRRQRVDVRTAGPVAAELLAWAKWAGLGEFEVYVGGNAPREIRGVRTEGTAAFVLGGEVRALDRTSRASLVREVIALKLGASACERADDRRMSAALVALLQELELPVAPSRLAAPAPADQAVIAKAVRKEISRRVRKAAAEPARAFASASNVALPTALEGLRRTMDRLVTVLVGDASAALASGLRVAPAELPALAPSNERARSLLQFVLSSNFTELSRGLGTGAR
jgi:hypothetical protein